MERKYGCTCVTSRTLFIKRSHCSGNPQDKLFQRSSQWYLPAKNDLKYYCVFMIPIPTYHSIKNVIGFCSGSHAPLSIFLRMTITLENDKDVIVYTFEKIISYTQNNQDIFLAQSVWWISLIIDLQQRLVIYIDNLKVQGNIGKAAAASDTQLMNSSQLATLRESSNEVRIRKTSWSVPPKPISIPRWLRITKSN